jgi:hypothetical protein
VVATSFIGDFSCAPDFKVSAKNSRAQIVSNFFACIRIDSSQSEFISKNSTRLPWRRLQPAWFGPCNHKNPQAKQAAEKVFYSVILSGAKNLSFFVFLVLNRREILRSAQNDRIGEFFRNR